MTEVDSDLLYYCSGTDVEPKFNTETFLQEMESFTEQMRVLSTLQLPDASSLVIGPLAVSLRNFSH